MIELIIAAFIITAVFVGYYASQEPRTNCRTTGRINRIGGLNKQTTQILYIKQI